MKVTIVVPIYNETKSLPKFQDLIEQSKSKEIKFLFVDNGSTDEMVSQILNRKSEYWSQIRTDLNLGFGGGILFGINASKSEFVGWMPGNLKVDPREVVSTLENIKIERVQFFKATRSERKLESRLKTYIFGVVQTLLFKVNMFDSGGTPTICTKEFIQGLSSPPVDFVFESFVLYQARRKGLEVVRLPIKYGERAFGVSHWQRGLGSELKLMLQTWKSSRKWDK